MALWGLGRDTDIFQIVKLLKANDCFAQNTKYLFKTFPCFSVAPLPSQVCLHAADQYWGAAVFTLVSDHYM